MVATSAVKTSKLIDKDDVCTQNQYWGWGLLVGSRCYIFVLDMKNNLCRSYIRLS